MQNDSDKKIISYTHSNIWQTLNKPFFILAPMYDVTDTVFRQIIAKYSKPDLMFTEFVSADGIMSQGREKLINHLWLSQNEGPVIAQIFGNNPDTIESTAEFIESLGFAGVDINMGCPEKNVMKQGSCAALYRNPKLAQQIIFAAKRGTKLPVSIKIRIGDTIISYKDWIENLLQAEPANITIHLRTRKEMSLVPAHWEEMDKIVTLIHEYCQKHNLSIPTITGNGDVSSLIDAREKIKKYHPDGIMFGRAIFGNPWLFNENSEVSTKEKLTALLEHCKLYDQVFRAPDHVGRGVKSFDIMKRHFKSYTQGISNASHLREKLYECQNSNDVSKILKPITKNIF